MPPTSLFRLRSVRIGIVLALGASAGCGGGGPRAADVERALANGDLAEAWRRSTAVVVADSMNVDGWIARARVALWTERTVDGLEATDRATRLAPARAEAWLLRAYLEQKRFRNVAAVAAADSARRLAPEDLRCVRAAGELRLGGGMVGTADYEGAEAAFRAALALVRDDARSTFGLGRTLVLAGRRAEGVPLLERAIALRPALSGPWYDRGVARMRDREFEGAAADFAEATRRDPFDASAWFNRARVLDRLGEKAEAERCRLRSDDARARTGPLPSIAVSWHSAGALGNGLQLAHALLEAGREAEALRLAHTLAEEQPGVPPALLEWSEAALANDRPAEAFDAAERAVEMAPRNARGWIARLRAAREDPDGADAMRVAGLAWPGAPTPELEVERAVLLLEQGRWEEAVVPLQAAAAAAPNDARVVAALGHQAMLAGRLAEADGRLSAAIQADPRAEWIVLRARVRRDSGRLALARDDLRWATERDPERSEAWERLAAVQREMGSEEEARACDVKREEIRRREQAIAEARARRDASPLDPSAAEHLAASLLESGRPHDAAQVWESVDAFGRLP
jgi:tetratricopeptide (TPR) repeat protein